MQQAVKQRETKFFSRQQHKFMKTTDQTGGNDRGEEPTMLDKIYSQTTLCYCLPCCIPKSTKLDVSTNQSIDIPDQVLPNTN